MEFRTKAAVNALLCKGLADTGKVFGPWVYSLADSPALQIVYKHTKTPNKAVVLVARTFIGKGSTIKNQNTTEIIGEPCLGLIDSSADVIGLNSRYDILKGQPITKYDIGEKPANGIQRVIVSLKTMEAGSLIESENVRPTWAYVASANEKIATNISQLQGRRLRCTVPQGAFFFESSLLK